MGLYQGYHLHTRGLNETHPYLKVSNDKVEFGIFKNSYNRNSLFVAYMPDEFIRIGLTTGYKRKESAAYFGGGISAIVMTEFKLSSLGASSISLSLLGESINLGISYSIALN